MRTFAALVIAVTSASVALACPRGARCVTNAPPRVEIAQARRATAAPTARTLSLTAEKTPRLTERTRWNLRDVPSKTGTTMPRIWQVVRTKVADKLPTYRSERGFAFSLSPVVVVSDAFDAAPCLGISGGF